MKRLIVFVVLACCLSSCLISLHPLYTKETIVYDPLLEGQWVENLEPGSETEPNCWIFRPKEMSIKMSVGDGNGAMQTVRNQDGYEGHYNLAHINSDGNYAYDAVLLKLGNYYYLDVLPEAPIDDPKKFMDAEFPGINNLKKNRESYPSLANYIATHSFYRVDFENDKKILLYPFDPDRLEKLVKERKIRIKHENVDGNFVITASTEDLQKFILKYATDPDNFEEPTTLELE